MQRAIRQLKTLKLLCAQMNMIQDKVTLCPNEYIQENSVVGRWKFSNNETHKSVTVTYNLKIIQLPWFFEEKTWYKIEVLGRSN